MTLNASEELAHLRAREDARTAFATLFAAHRSTVLALCTHLTGRREDAEDAVQETFLAVHRSLSSFRGDARLSTWIYRIAIRACGVVRAHQRPNEPLTDELVDASPRPDEAAGSRLEANRVVRALEALSADQRAVIALFAVEGLRHGEIADVLGIPEGTVWSRLHLARKRLAAVLAEQDPREQGGSVGQDAPADSTTSARQRCAAANTP